MVQLLKHLRERLEGSIPAENTIWMIGGYGGRFLTQGLYFFVLARELGAEGLGVFAGALAFVNILSPFSGLGSGEVLLMKTSRRKEELPYVWGAALLKTTVGALLLTALSVGFAPLIVGSEFQHMVFHVAVAELFFNRLTTSAGQVFQAVERMKLTAYIYTVTGSTRLGAVLLYVGFSSNPTVSGWAVWYLGANLIATLFGVSIVTSRTILPRFKREFIMSDLWKGLSFAVGVSSRSVYKDADKTMLNRMDSSASAGIYTAAYRIVSAAFTPVRALMTATYVRFFQAGARSREEVWSEMKKVIPVAILYGGAVWVSLYIVAPILPYVLGQDFQESVQALRILGALPAIQAVHFALGNGLDGIDRPGLRGGIQVFAATLNVGVNIPLIIYASWKGAAVGTIVTETVLALLLGIIFYREVKGKNSNKTFN